MVTLFLMDLKTLKEAGYEATITPSDGSAGVLDEDEKRNLVVGGVMAAIAVALLTVGVIKNDDFFKGAGLPLITSGAAIAVTGKVKGKS